MRNRSKEMTKTRIRRHICLLLCVLMLAAALPVSMSAATGSINPGQKVSGTLQRGSLYDTYILSGMNVSDYWGVRLTMTVNGATSYEIWLTEDVVGGSWYDIYTVEVYPGAEFSGLTWTSTGFVLEFPVAKYVIEEYTYTVSIPEYAAGDFPSSARFNYTLELYQDGADPSPPAGALPSEWAQDDVDKAIDLGLVPQSLQSEYSRPTKRAEFCAFAVTLYEKEKGTIYGRTKFSDTSDENVEKAASIGVVNGVGDGNFAPNDSLTREQAATMLARLADAIDRPIAKTTATFADGGQISPWAGESVGQIQSAGIMQGVGNNLFAPRDPYTREQSIMTILRMYNYVHTPGGASTQPDPDQSQPSDALSGTSWLGASGGGDWIIELAFSMDGRFYEVGYHYMSESTPFIHWQVAEGAYSVSGDRVSFSGAKNIYDAAGNYTQESYSSPSNAFSISGNALTIMFDEMPVEYDREAPSGNWEFGKMVLFPK